MLQATPVVEAVEAVEAPAKDPCRTCGDSGWILETVVDFVASVVDSREVACPRCHPPRCDD